MSSLAITNAQDLFTATQSMADITPSASTESPDALRKVAQQYESLFLQMMMQSMRDASLAEGVLDNDDSEFYMQMMDRQIALSLSRNNSIGIAELMMRQLRNPTPDATAETSSTEIATPMPLPGPDAQATIPDNLLTPALVEKPISATASPTQSREKSLEYYRRIMY